MLLQTFKFHLALALWTRQLSLWTRISLGLRFVRGTLGFSVLRFWLFFRSVFSVFVPKDFGFSVLVFIAVCRFFVYQHLVFGFRRSYLRFFGFVMRCGFWVFLFCPISGFRFCPNFYAVLRFWVIFSSVFRFLIYPNAPLFCRHPTTNKAFKRGSSFCSSSRSYLQNEDPIDLVSACNEQSI